MLNRTGAVIYVGNLPDDIRERELDDLFYKARLRGNGGMSACSQGVSVHLPALPPAYPFGPPADLPTAAWVCCELGSAAVSQHVCW